MHDHHGNSAVVIFEHLERLIDQVALFFQIFSAMVIGSFCRSMSTGSNADLDNVALVFRYEVGPDAAIGANRRDALRDQHREDAAIARDDLKSAQRLEKAREQETAEVRLAQRDIHHDRTGIAHDCKDRSHEAVARKDEMQNVLLNPRPRPL